MLDEVIVNQIIEREIGKEKKERKDSGWQPLPLYKELELPSDIPQKKEKSPSGPIEIDIWGPPPDENGLTVIQTHSYHSFSNYR
ncbi:MAG: hypothetical protein Q8R47_04535 [Nanoarchaeota archaeon]|nr:hypothetical protein [Nanoarchaeota archaeon]